jgi:tRNA threonylcarbamoyladenosine biosynthesis protein TsaB
VKTPNPEPQTLNPVYLGLDTATPYLSLALWSPEHGVVRGFAENIGRDHAKRIIVEIDNLFQRANVVPSQLAGIGVGVGPGSYTGVRVGIATAKALAKGLNVPLIGVGTLAAMAYGVLKEGEQGVVAMDARRGSVYAGVFEKRGEDVLERTPPQKIELTKLHEQYPSYAYVQDSCPDAGYIAQCVYYSRTVPVEAIYL